MSFHPYKHGNQHDHYFNMFNPIYNQRHVEHFYGATKAEAEAEAEGPTKVPSTGPISQWGQCGGFQADGTTPWEGGTECQTGCDCEEINQGWSMCKPTEGCQCDTEPPTTGPISQWGQCGGFQADGSPWKGGTECQTGCDCHEINQGWSMCKPTEGCRCDTDQPIPTSKPTTKPNPGGNDDCSTQWGQCGGTGWNGPTCCQSGLTCEKQGEWYSQCIKDTQANDPNCNGDWEQCGGKNWTGPTCCQSGYTCQSQGEWYSQCTPYDSGTTPTSGPGPIPTQPGPTQPGPTQPGPTQPGPTQPGPTQPGPTQPGPTQPGPTQPGPTQPGPTQPGDGPDGDWMTAQGTHYWDCALNSCDGPSGGGSTGIWQIANKEPATPCNDGPMCYAPPGYAPINPQDQGGAKYGEKLWLTAAVTDSVSYQLGDNAEGSVADGNWLGSAAYRQWPHSKNGGGCGKCMLVKLKNPNDAKHSDWKAVVMKKNQCGCRTLLNKTGDSADCCQPLTLGNECGSSGDKMCPHIDLAVPGWDFMGVSDTNKCGNPNTGMKDGETERNTCATNDVYPKSLACCDKLSDPAFKKSCQLFQSWGWNRGDPELEWKPVECPEKFVEIIAKAQQDHVDKAKLMKPDV